MNLPYAIFCLLLLSVSSVPAVDTLQVMSPDPVLEKWRWTTFGGNSGIAGTVWDIFEDRDGNIWFATNKGVQSYDGFEWTTYTKKDGLVDNNVFTGIQTDDGAMWFGTYKGLSRFDPAVEPGQDAWTTYTTEDGLVQDIVLLRGLHQDRAGTLWAGFNDLHNPAGTHTGGISRFDGQTWTTIDVPGAAPRPSIVDIHEAADGAMWFTTPGHGILRFDGSRWEQYTTDDGLVSNAMGQILESADGTLWFGGIESPGINRFDPSAPAGQSWQAYTSQDGLPEKVDVGMIWQTEDGTLWAGSNVEGIICRFDPEDRSGRGNWKAYASDDTPLDANVAGYPTSDGAVWLYDWGTFKVFRFDYSASQWAGFAFEDGLSGGAYSPDDGLLWFRTEKGPVSYDGVHWLRHTADDGLIDAPFFRAYLDDDGSYWVLGGELGHFSGASQYRDGTWLSYSATEVGLDDVSFVIQATDGAYWFGGSLEGKSAASRYAPSIGGEERSLAWQIFTHRDGLAGEALHFALVAANGDLWFASRRHPSSVAMKADGVFRYDGAQWARYTTDNGLSHNRGYDLEETLDGTIWVGTFTGLSGFDGTKWHTYTIEDGLPVGKPRGFVSDDEGIWFRYQTNQGAGVTYCDFSSGAGQAVFRTYTERDGLVSNEVSWIHEAADNALWFATTGGVSRFDGQIWSNHGENQGLLEQDIGHIAEGPKGTLWFRSQDGTKLSRFISGSDAPETTLGIAPKEVPSGGDLIVRWHGRDLWEGTAVSDLRYQWRLGNGPWSSGISGTEHLFTALAPGSYAFEVRTVDGDGNTDATPAAHAFTVLPPWWLRNEVVGLGLLLLGLVGLQTARVVRRDRHLQKVNAHLATSNEELTLEAALDRVRGMALGMQESMELSPLVNVFRQELEALGVPAVGFSIGIMDEEGQVWNNWVEVQKGQRRVVRLPFSELFEMAGQGKIVDSWKKQEKYVSIALSPEEWLAYRQYWKKKCLEAYPEIPRSEPELSDKGVWCHAFHFQQGSIHLITSAPLSERLSETCMRFTDLFAFAYNRFLELEEKERRNRELEVENALERVRSQAQGMQKSEDLSHIASTVGDELRNLKVPIVDGVGIRIVNEEEAFLAIWLPGPEGQTRLLRVSFDEWFEVSPGAKRAYDVWKNGEKVCVLEVSPEQQLVTNRWWHQKNLEAYPGRPRPEPQLRDRSTLRYFFNFAQGSLRLNSGSDPLSEPDRAICIRFTEVFAFAYNRFLELQEKEARNRELEVEIALERVRSQAQGMQKSEDLSLIASGMRDGLRNLAIQVQGGVAVAIVDEAEEALDMWMSEQEDQTRLIRASFEELPQVRRFREIVLSAWKNGEKESSSEWSPEEVLESSQWWNEKCLEAYPDLPRPEPRLPNNSTWTHYFNFDQGYIYFFIGYPLSETDRAICIRFTEVFAFAYNRFLELEEKEARNRELVIENALERLRSQAQGMQKSDDLSEVASTFSGELRNLGVPLNGFAIWTVDEDEETSVAWAPVMQGQTRKLHTTFEESSQFWWVKANHDAWKKGEAGSIVEVSPEDVVPFFQWWNEKLLEAYPDLPRPEPQLQDHSTWFWNFNFPQGTTGIASAQPPSEQERDICRRMTDVFAFAYTRYLELQGAEIQARNAERRAAVDRVRAEAMAMRKAEDLEGVVLEVVKELIAAGVKFDATGIHIVDEDAGIRRHYAGFTQGPTHRDDTPLSQVSDEWMNIWKGGKPVVRHLTRPAVQDTGAPANWHRERADVILDAPFTYGTFAINVEAPAGFSEDEIALVADFADVISLGYTRYLDFQNLEENNKALAVANTQIQEQTERKSAFLASMSHELRTPMNAIKGFTNLVLRREENLSERNKENLEKVTLASDHLLAMIDDLLDLSKIEAGRMDVNPEPFDVNALIASCCATVSPLMAERPFVELNYEVDGAIEKANTDAGRIRQMVINLLSNAIKFTDEGEVKIRVQRSDANGQGMLEIAVSDTGKGIPEDELESIFDEYRQVKGQSESDVQKGTGLGLSITRQFAELLGGTIEVESGVGKGTVFTVQLPLEFTL